MHVISVELQSLPFDVMSRFLVPTSMDSCLFVFIYVFFYFSFWTSIFFMRQAFLGDTSLRLLWPFSPRQPDQTKKKQSGASESIWLCSDRAGVCDGGTASKQRDLEESLQKTMSRGQPGLCYSRFHEVASYLGAAFSYDEMDIKMLHLVQVASNVVAVYV